MSFPSTCILCGKTVQVVSRIHQARQKYCSRTCAGIARTLHADATRDERMKQRPTRPCRHCQTAFVPAYRAAAFCSKKCSSRWQADQIRGPLTERERKAVRRALARAFVKDVNAKTVCAHCGAQPIEWHNPEHVEKGRQAYRISRLVQAPRTITVIRAEMDRCTPLCRRCHMAEDGRLRRFIEARGGRHAKRAADRAREAAARKPLKGYADLYKTCQASGCTDDPEPREAFCYSHATVSAF